MVLPNTQPKYAAWLVIGIAVFACAAIYTPGLYGSFVFDDSVFVIANIAVHVSSLHLGDWVAAALSFPASHQGRWLGMLSFAANHYFTGMDPFWLKLTNLGIHLLNGILVFLMLRALFALWSECRPEVAREHAFDRALAAAVLAGLWLVLPINLTGVLYISQRLESFSNTFIFLGLWWYLTVRLSHWRGEQGPSGLWMSLLISTGVGLLVKESAVMLPLYALCVEFAVTGMRAQDGRKSRSVLSLYGILIGLPVVIGTVWLVSWVGGASSYARPFSTIERVLTEARVLVDYIRWTLVPQPESLTLYHDDVAISQSLLDPRSTLAALAGLLALLGAALWQRSRRPLFSLGVLWFFAGHLLTGTVIPLMLAFEHRNYFPSVGLLLAGASLVVLEGGLARMRARALLAGCLFVFYAFVTWMRAEEWSDPLRLALSEANKRPDSPAAQYELGSLLLHSYRKGESAPMTQQAFEVLERAARLPNSDAMIEQALIVSHAALKQPINPAWWDSLIAKLSSRPPTTADITALTELLKCYADQVCSGEVERLRLAFEAAVAHPSADAVLLSAYGQFIEQHLGASALAENQFRAAISTAPNDPIMHANLVRFLIHQRRFAEAKAELQGLRRLNHFGSLDDRIARLDIMLRETESATSPSAFNADSGR